MTDLVDLATTTSDDVAGPLLQIRDLSISFGPGRDAVSGLSLDAARGDIVAIVGESGCGKTLTALSLIGLLPVGATASGSARIGELELIGLTGKNQRRVRGRRVSMIFQDAATALNPLMSVGAQIQEVLIIHGRTVRSQRRARVIELLESVGVPDPVTRARSLPHQLSGGMRQRVMVAIALAGSPDLIVADEPTTALDVTVQAQVLALLRESTLNAAMLFITHDMGVVAELADRVIVMYAGTVVESGPIDEVLQKPHHPYTSALLASVPDPDEPIDGDLPTIPGRVPPLGERGTGCPFAERCSRRTDQCAQLPPLNPLMNTSSDEVDPSRVACWHPLNTTTDGD